MIDDRVVVFHVFGEETTTGLEQIISHKHYLRLLLLVSGIEVLKNVLILLDPYDSVVGTSHP